MYNYILPLAIMVTILMGLFTINTADFQKDVFGEIRDPVSDKPLPNSKVSKWYRFYKWFFFGMALVSAVVLSLYIKMIF